MQNLNRGTGGKTKEVDVELQGKVAGVIHRGKSQGEVAGGGYKYTCVVLLHTLGKEGTKLTSYSW